MLMATSASAVGDSTTWSVNATSGYAGELEAKFNHEAVRFNLAKFGLTIATHAPKWDAVLYNESTKKYMEVPHGQWEQRFKVLLGGRKKNTKERKLKTKRTGETKIFAGIKGEEIVVTDVSKDAKPGFYMDLWIAEQITPPEQFTFFLKEVLGIPAERGLPLKVINVEPKRKVTVYEAVKVGHDPMPKNAFTLPKGMIKVQDEMQLLIDDSEFDTTDGADTKSTPPAKGKTK